MARRRAGAIGWPGSAIERLDLETVFSSGEECCLPMGWSWADVRAAWFTVGAEFIGEGETCWALEAWGAPGEGLRASPKGTAVGARRKEEQCGTSGFKAPE